MDVDIGVEEKWYLDQGAVRTAVATAPEPLPPVKVTVGAEV